MFRYLQTLNSISAENNSTIIFPVPIDIMSEFMQTSSSAQSSVLGQWAASTGGRIIICVKHCIMRIDDLVNFLLLQLVDRKNIFKNISIEKLICFYWGRDLNLFCRTGLWGPACGGSMARTVAADSFCGRRPEKYFVRKCVPHLGPGQRGSSTSASRHAAEPLYLEAAHFIVLQSPCTIHKH